MKIDFLRTNHMENPIGFQMDGLVFSWKVRETKAREQVASRVDISLSPDFSRLIFTSGEEELSSVCYEPAFVPKPETRYYWRVTVWGDNGESAVSDPAFFETPLAEGFAADWITTPFEKDIHPYMRRSFTLPKKGEARLYICGLGLYEAYINGARVGDEYLTPYCNDYRNFIQYQTYDVTDLLREGENAVGVMLGAGWYKGRFGFDGGARDTFGDRFALICELHVNGEPVLLSDESWRCAPSPVLESGIYDGEVYDANKEQEGWCEPGFSEESWEAAAAAALAKDKLVPRLSLPVRDQEILTDPDVITTPKGETVLDFRQEITGTVLLEEETEQGERISFKAGEILQEGCFYRDNLRTAKAEYTYIAKGGKAVIRPKFTFYGFRYLLVENVKNFKGVKAVVLHSDMPRTGRIETADPKVNRLIQNTLWGQKGNFLDVPTDCPQRDERMGWTGDAQVFCRTASYHMYTPAFYRKYLCDMLEEQKTLGGAVPHVVPDLIVREAVEKSGDSMFARDGEGQIAETKGYISEVIPDEGRYDASCAWADAATVIPWTLYEMFGDRELLARQYENMRRWCEYLYRIDEKSGNTRLWHTGFHFADWLALDNPDHESRFGATDSYYVASAYYYLSVSLTGKAARVLGREPEAEAYEKRASEVLEAIRREYFSPNGRLTERTQTAHVLALYFGLAEERFRPRLKEELRRLIVGSGMKLNTGFVGTAYLCAALSEAGLSDYAYSLLLREEYPGWLYEVNMGATTVWERWNSVLPDGKISGIDMNSLNHYAYGAVAGWMYGYMCGIRPLEPGFRKALIAPEPDRRLKSAKASYDSAAGEYACGWEYTAEGLTVSVSVPFDGQARLCLPVKEGETAWRDGKAEKPEQILKAGSYRFVIR